MSNMSHPGLFLYQKITWWPTSL